MSSFQWPSNGDLAYFLLNERLGLYEESGYVLQIFRNNQHQFTMPMLVVADGKNGEWEGGTMVLLEGSNDSLPPVERTRQQLTSCHMTQLYPDHTGSQIPQPTCEDKCQLNLYLHFLLAKKTLAQFFVLPTEWEKLTMQTTGGILPPISSPASPPIPILSLILSETLKWW